MSGINRLTMDHISARTNRFCRDLIQASAHFEIGSDGNDRLTVDYVADLAALQSAVYTFLTKHPTSPVTAITTDEAVSVLRAAL